MSIMVRGIFSNIFFFKLEYCSRFSLYRNEKWKFKDSKWLPAAFLLLFFFLSNLKLYIWAILMLYLFLASVKTENFSNMWNSTSYYNNKVFTFYLQYFYCFLLEENRESSEIVEFKMTVNIWVALFPNFMF